MALGKFQTAAVSAIVTVALAGTASAQQRTARADTGNQTVCKTPVATGTRLPKRVCKTRAQWDAMREQHMRDAKEWIDRPVIETSRGG